MEIDLKKIENSDAKPEVLAVYKRVKRFFVDDEKRKVWKDNRKKNWDAAYPLDTEEEGIWTKDEKAAMIKKGQIPIGVNDLAKGVQGSCAVVTSKNPGLNFSPIGSSDLYVSELLKRGWDYTLNKNGGPVLFFGWIQECKVGALSCMEAKHDPSKGIYGKIMIGEFDPTTYYFDRKSRKSDHSDVPFGKAHLVTKQYALDTYDGLTDEDLKFSPIQQEEAKDGGKPVDSVPGTDGYVTQTGNAKGDGPKEGEEEENVWEIEDWELAKVKELWVMIPSQEKPGEFDREVYKTKAEAEAAGWVFDKGDKTATRMQQAPPVTVDGMGNVGVDQPPAEQIQAVIWPRRVEKRIQRIVIGKKLVSEEVNPLGVDADGEPVLPIITLCHDRTLSGYPTCPTTRAYEISRSRNKRRMQSIYVVSKNIEAPIVMSNGSKWVKDEEHGDHIEMAKDAPFPVTRLLPGTTSAELVNMEQRDKEDLNDEYDMSDVVRGKIPPGQSNIAGRTVLALQDMVGVMSQPFVLTVEAAMERVGKAAAALMLKTWPKSMWLRLIDEEDMGKWQPEKEKQVDAQGNQQAPEPSMIQERWMQAIARITGEDGGEPMTMIDLDVKIIGGSTQPTNRMAKQGVALEMVKAGVYDPEAALEYTDDPLKDKVIERIKNRPPAPDKVNITVNIKDLPPEVQAQIMAQRGIQMDPNNAVPPETSA
jgi:hypothetical protein